MPQLVPLENDLVERLVEAGLLLHDGELRVLQELLEFAEDALVVGVLDLLHELFHGEIVLS